MPRCLALSGGFTPPTSTPPNGPSAAPSPYQPPRRQQLARQRQRAADQRAADQAAKLGFEGVRAYLVDRVLTKAWTLAQVQGELGIAPATLRRLLDHYRVWR